MYLCSVPLSICIRKLNASSSREARRYLDKHLRLDTALQSYMSNRENTSTPSSNELEKLFNKYKGVQLVPAALACPFLTHRLRPSRRRYHRGWYHQLMQRSRRRSRRCRPPRSRLRTQVSKRRSMEEGKLDTGMERTRVCPSTHPAIATCTAPFPLRPLLLIAQNAASIRLKG